ncbi:hypothetical protein SAVIM40S_02046 [Streptomyces avidinii]
MVGRAVETMVWSSAAISRPSSSAPMETSTSREVCSEAGPVFFSGSGAGSVPCAVTS